MSAESKADRMVCGCWSGSVHEPDCVLGAAEEIASEAAEIATANGDHPLRTAVSALIEAGILTGIPADQVDDVLFGLLDDLWEVGAIGPAERPQSTIEHAEAASPVSDQATAWPIGPAPVTTPASRIPPGGRELECNG